MAEKEFSEITPSPLRKKTKRAKTLLQDTSTSDLPHDKYKA